MARAGFAVLRGALQARALYREIGPRVVVGFGGYPSAPALVGALIDRRPTVIHEQNAVMGRANRMLAARVTRVACAFPTLLKAPADVAGRATVVGNPVRPAIRALADLPRGLAPHRSRTPLWIGMDLATGPDVHVECVIEREASPAESASPFWRLFRGNWRTGRHRTAIGSPPATDDRS